MVQIALKMMGQPHKYDLASGSSGSCYEKTAFYFCRVRMEHQQGLTFPMNRQKKILSRKRVYSRQLFDQALAGQFDNYTPMQLAQYAATVTK